MVTHEPTVCPTSHYSIGQTAALLGIHRNTLRRYTEQGRIRPNVHAGTNKTYYKGLEILRFWNR
jgi:DNA-binding transcriptional MerR regulator